MLEAAWIALLVAPAASRLPDALAWQLDDVARAVAPLWLVALLRLLLPRRSFFAATWPIAAIGVLVAGASLLRGIDPLDLFLQLRTYAPAELAAALSPYAGMALGSLTLVTALAWGAWRHAASRSPSRRSRAVAAAATLAAALALPAATLVKLWPAEPVLAAASVAANSHWLANRLYPEASTFDPRDPAASWHASRAPGAAAHETVVMIVGESVRDDYLKECGGPALVRPVDADALVACDVVAGADQTGASVPLLISRELPGHPVRVSSDGSFLRALDESGFATRWIALTHQRRDVAWPDAAQVAFTTIAHDSDAWLIPALDATLREPASLKAVVLHAYNAHDPYCQRFDPATAPYPVDCSARSQHWREESMATKRRSYADAVDASVGFVNQVIARLRQQPEPVFLVFSSDHGDALMDDGRHIVGHARRYPTRWDSHVPAVFWANDAWRRAHAAQWARLAAQKGLPLMHMDLVPTLLDAAGVRYDEPRTQAVDLLAQAVPARQRLVQVAPGRVVDWQTLVGEARVAGPAAPAAR
ncbi:MAG: sulfatase-like hydrolase/transferase [Burkholderiales bacterium]|nr:sulfatase-like hydrolase/transferase [Burkholderiales bacterium]